MSHDLVAKTFDQWALNGRDHSMEAGHGDVVRQVVERLNVRPGERILDLGCGNGWATRLLAKAGPGATAVGVDVAPLMIARAEALHSFTIRARYEVAPFEQLPFPDGQFDRVFSMEALYYAVDLDRTLLEAFRVLKTGGLVDVIVDFFKESPSTAQWLHCTGVPMRYLSEKEWTACFERAGFREVALQRVVDRRGPGTAESCQPDECVPDWETKRRLWEAGSLWMHAVRPP